MGSCLSKDEPVEKPSPKTGRTNTPAATGGSYNKGHVSSSSSSNNNNSNSHVIAALNGTANQATSQSLANSASNTNNLPAIKNSNGDVINGSSPGGIRSDGNTNTGVVANNVNTVGTDDKEFKILLLGSGESGKSTILKQMKIIHQNGYTKDELIDYKPFVFRNVLDCAKAIAKCYKDFNYPISMDVPLVNGAYGARQITNDGKNQVVKPSKDEKDDIPDDEVNALTEADIDLILSTTVSSDPNESFDPNVVLAIASLWKANSTKNLLVEHKNKFYLMDSAKYFFQNLKRISDNNYIPNVTDVLRTRKKTSGIFETRFNMGTSKIHMVDVGGQRSERKKWIHCFDNVTIIIFCVALSEYDQPLLEENSQNRLEESLVLFDSVVNSRWFSRTSIVLFLNKIDVFAEKLEHSPLENYFPDYTGGNDITKAAKYILWRFKQVNRSNLTIYPHVTQATDTSNIKVVFAAVQETILQNSLKDSGILTLS